MNTTSIRLDRMVAIDYLLVRNGSECACTTTTEETPQTTEQSTETTEKSTELTEIDEFKSEIHKWISISIVAIVVATASMTMSVCICMFHVKSPTNYECKIEEKSDVVQTGGSQLASNL